MSTPMSLTKAKLVAKAPEEFSIQELDDALTTIVESDRLSEAQVTRLQAKIDPVLRARMVRKPVHAVLAGYAAEYAARVWPDLPAPTPTQDDLEGMEIRSDCWADAHVGAEHEIWSDCTYTDPTECGLRSAAAEYVESN